MSERWTVGDVLEDDNGFEYVVVGEEDKTLVASVWKGVFEDGADVMARARLIAVAPALRDALREIMALLGESIRHWCMNYYPELGESGCGECIGCLAWQTAHDALAMVEPSND